MYETLNSKENILNNLRTGDVILMNPHRSFPLSCLSKAIKFFTSSKFSHVGMILKDPYFVADKAKLPREQFKGIFVWESGWEGEPDPQDNKVKLGVQITPIEQFLKDNNGTAYIRKIICTDTVYKSTFTDKKLLKVHELVYNKHYDINILDWIEALFRINLTPQHKDRFWCSALVGIIYNKLGIVEENTDWSIMRPSDFSLEDKNNHINFTQNYKLSDYQLEILSD